MTSPYQKARNEGYTDEEILSFWEKKNPAHALPAIAISLLRCPSLQTLKK